jgi:hypothetical protein
MMLVLLNEFSCKNSDLVERLAGYTDVSIFLSVSQEDTLRILREVKPDVAIFRRSYAAESSFVRELSADYPMISFYLFDDQNTRNAKTELENYRNHQHLAVQSVINPENKTGRDAKTDKQSKSSLKPRREK